MLVAPEGALDETRLLALRAALALARVQTGAERWLAPNEAWEAEIDSPRTALDAARLGVAAWPVDVAVMPKAARRKRLLVADMESTMIENEMLVEMAELCELGKAIEAETQLAMQGEIDFKTSLSARVRRFAGQPVALLDRARARIRPMKGARVLVATMRAHGAKAALVTGGFTHFSDPVGADLGFDEVASNRLLLADGKLTGTVAEPILGPEEKRATLMRLVETNGLKSAETLAVGDGANDVPMFKAAGLAVAFRPKPVAAAAAHARIDHADLTALLFLQGYRRDEFATA